jgi:hypothetical protein
MDPQSCMNAKDDEQSTGPLPLSYLCLRVSYLKLHLQLNLLPPPLLFVYRVPLCIVGTGIVVLGTTITTVPM